MHTSAERLVAIPSRLHVLDKGYVHLVGMLGSELDERAARIIRFMGRARPQHESPFRGTILKFRVKAPLLVARQWFKYRIGSEHSGDTAELAGIPHEYVEAVLSWLAGGNGDD